MTFTTDIFKISETRPVPTLTLHNNEYIFRFIIDTGSEYSILDKRVLEILDYIPKQSVIGSFIGAGSIDKLRKDEVNACTTDLYLEDHKLSIDFLVHDMSIPFNAIARRDNVTIAGLLGMDFLDKYKGIIDFGKQIITMDFTHDLPDKQTDTTV